MVATTLVRRQPHFKTLPSLCPTPGTSRSECRSFLIRGFVSKRKPVILLVDDEQIVRQMLAYTLEDAGLSVIQAGNGAAALQAVHQWNGGIKLVVTDVNMPVMDGLELAQTLGLLQPTLPILFVTGRDPALISDAGFRAETLLKPFGPDEFLGVVLRLITPLPNTDLRPAIRPSGGRRVSRPARQERTGSREDRGGA